jgi:hypothetical protein
MSNNLVHFECKHCTSKLVTPSAKRGDMVQCPACNANIRVPRKKRRQPPSPSSQDPTVPVQMSIPGGPSFKGEVSRSDAGKMGFTFLGALLAIICFIFGIKASNRS